MLGARRFCAILLGLCLACLAAAGSVVYVVDPFNLLGRNWTGLHAASERQGKPALLRAGAYHAVLLGSSKTAYIDPGALCLPGIFNASFPGATPEEMLEFTRKFIHDQELALIGLDLFMFNERELPLRDEAFPETDLGRVLTYLLGWRPFERSLRTLLRHWRGDEPFLRSDGSRTASRQLQRHARMPAPDHAAALDYLMTRHYGDFRFSTTRLRLAAELKAVLDARGIRHRVFINPLSRPILDRLRPHPAWHELLRLRRELKRIFPDLIDLSQSRYSDPVNFFRFDPLHYLPEAGARFMNEVVLDELCARPGSIAAREPDDRA